MSCRAFGRESRRADVRTGRARDAAAILVALDRKTTVVASLSIFGRLDPRSLEAVATLAVERSVPVGSVLVHEGDPADSFFVIVSGTIQIERAGVFVRSMSDGGFLGEIGLLEDRGRTATAICSTDCKLLELGAHEFSRVLATFSDVKTRVEAAVARRPHEDGH